MITLSWFSILFFAASASAQTPSAPQERPSLRMSVGEQRILRIQDLQRYSIGGSCLRAQSLDQDGAKALMLKAVCPGHVDVWIWKASGATEVRAVEMEHTPPSLMEEPRLWRALGKLTETEIFTAVSGVILRGEIQSESEAVRVAGLVSGFPKTVQDETTMADSALQAAEERLVRWVATLSERDALRIDRDAGRLWLRGSVASPSVRAALESGARARCPWVRTELDSLPDSAPTVHFKVYLLELQRQAYRSLGASWPAQVERALNATPTDLAPAFNLDVALNALEERGEARILSQPELVVRAPGEAELFAGGEFPIRTRLKSGLIQVEWRKFGLSLKLAVQALSGPRVRLDIQTEVSHLDASLSVEDIPGIQANRMKTQVDATFGKPLLLSGLLQEDLRKKASGLPFLREIPVLGTLFGSESYVKGRSELVAILWPEATPPEPRTPRVRSRAEASLSPRADLGLAETPKSDSPPKSGPLPIHNPQYFKAGAWSR